MIWSFPRWKTALREAGLTGTERSNPREEFAAQAENLPDTRDHNFDYFQNNSHPTTMAPKQNVEKTRAILFLFSRSIAIAVHLVGVAALS